MSKLFQTDQTQKGLIIKSIGGLYMVESPAGVFECKARGVFRNRGVIPFVGDKVIFADGVINEIEPRKNYIIRPPLANLDQVLFVVSTCKPVPNHMLLDKFIAISEYKGIKPVILITKVDLAGYDDFFEIYEKTGIDIIVIDYQNQESVKQVELMLNDRISAFTGNTGVGKSTLLNAIDVSLKIPTGEISEKLGRGRHTTRHVQLYKLSIGGYIADTPGFSTFDTNRYDIIKKEELSRCFVEFEKYAENCRFKDCSHTKEKGCAVIEAVKNGEIAESRHKSYCRMYEEAKLIKEWEIHNG